MSMNLDTILHRHLDPIINRREKIHSRRKRSIVFTVTAALAWFAFSAANEGSSQSPAWLLLPILGCLLTALIVRLFLRQKPIDLRKVAREIETDNPELQALLLTAVEQESNGELLSLIHI